MFPIRQTLTRAGTAKFAIVSIASTSDGSGTGPVYRRTGIRVRERPDQRGHMRLVNSVTLKIRPGLLAATGLLLIAVFVLPGTALAHERRTIGNGNYDVVVGWDVEPTYADLKNAASIRIMQAGTSTPVTGAEKTLKLTIRQGASTREFPLRAAFRQDGFYLADIVPTRVGDYQWIFSGSINGDQVNETFDTADGKFDAVQAPTALQFPAALPDPAQSGATVQSAQSDAQNARTLAYVGIAVGVLGLLSGVGAWLFRPHTPTPTPARAPTASERV